MAQSSSSSQALGQAASWLFAGACVIGSIFYFDELKAVGRVMLGVPSIEAESARLAAASRNAERAPAAPRSGSGTHVELRADARGHFVADAQINGRTIEVLVDTGATGVALSWEDAEAAGIYVKPSDFTMIANTANGQARIAPVMIDTISIDGITVRNVRGSVAERGRLGGTLLGMTFLSKLSRAELRQGVLILEE